MKKICFILPTTELGGGPKHLFDLLKRTDLNKWEPFVCTQNDGPYWEDFQKLNIKTYNLILRKISIITTFKLIILLLKEKPSLIHTHGPRAGFYGRMIGWLLRIPVIHTFHGFRFTHLSLSYRIPFIIIENFLGLITDHHICVGIGEKQRASILKLVPPTKFTIIHNGIDFEEIQNLSIDKERVLNSLGLESFIPYRIIGTIARIEPVKNIITLLKGFSGALGKVPDLRLIVIGGAPKGQEEYQEEVKQFIRNHHLETHTALLVDRKDARVILKCMDLFISSSLSEGLPLSLLEAFAAGVPIIATDIPGHKDVIRNSVFGLLLPQNSSQGLTNGILKMVSLDPAEREILIKNGFKRIKENFSLISMAQKTFFLYEKVLSGKN